MTLTGWLEVPSITVRDALDEYERLARGGDLADAMRGARLKAQQSAPGLRDVMSVPLCDGINAECLRRYEWEVETMKGTPYAAMRAALELDVTMTAEREYEERRHTKAREQAEADARRQS